MQKKSVEEYTACNKCWFYSKDADRCCAGGKVTKVFDHVTGTMLKFREKVCDCRDKNKGHCKDWKAVVR